MKKYQSLNEAFVEELSECANCGTEVGSRGFTQIERLFTSISIEDPTDISIAVPARKFNQDYAILEWLWYLNANSEIRNIGKFADIWNKISDENEKVESNYGSYLEPQWAHTIKELLSDKDSRRATIVINQPYHKNKNLKDYPCTHYIHFFIRENKLQLGVYMRSNDAVFGFCNDVFTFCLFQQLMLNELNARGAKISLGKYFHFAGSFHVYDRHYSMMEKISKNYRVSARKHGYPKDLDKTRLDPDLTWPKLKLITSFLDEDLDKETISDRINEVKEAIFK